jgi:hypothetical protein
LDLVGRIELPASTFRTGHIPKGSVAYRSDGTLPASSRVKLDHGIHGAWVRADGSFTIEGVEHGSYVLTPSVPGYTVASVSHHTTARAVLTVQVLISIFPDTSIDTSTTETIHVQPWHPTKLPNDPLKSPSLPYPFTLYGRQDDYFIPAPGMNIIGMFKSPMVLMMLFSGVMMYAMPKLQVRVNLSLIARGYGILTSRNR